jgi:16S rRNA G966 N2-methylase RsmD
MNSIYTHLLVNENNEPIPWFTYPSIQYLDQLDLSEKTIFEWGSGNSSLYFSRLCKNIISVENNFEWFNHVNNNKKNNQEVFYTKNKDEYISHIHKFQKFDIIVIDGDYRHDCSLESIKCLKDNGLIIFDNSNWYVESCDFLRNNNLIQVDMHGMGPINDYGWTTTLFFKRGYDFEPLGNTQPKKPIGGNLIYNCNN